MVGRLFVLATCIGCTFYEDVIQSPPHDAAVLDSSLGDVQDVVDAAVTDTPPDTLVGITQSLLYNFNEGDGSLAFSSDPDGRWPLRAVDPSAVRWIDGAIVIESSTTLHAEPPVAFYEACVASGELTVEAWIVPAESSLSDARRIVSSSVDPERRNFTLDQGTLLVGEPASRTYVGRIRAAGATTPNGLPGILTEDVARASLTHLVMVRTSTGRLRIYVNGVLVGNEVRDGDFQQWDPTFPLLVGNENGSGSAWLGEVHALRLDSRAWSGQEVREHRRLGPE